MVAHAHGVTLGQSVQDSFAIVHINEGANVKVQNAQGVYTDYWGNAIVPNMTNYRHNAITVNTQGTIVLIFLMPHKMLFLRKGLLLVSILMHVAEYEPC